MEKLFEMLERGEMPNFAQMLQAINDISDIDWDRVEASQLPFPASLDPGRVPNYLFLACREFCTSC